MSTPAPALLTAGSGGSAASFTTASQTYAVGKWYTAVILTEGSAGTANTPTISGWTLDRHTAEAGRDVCALTVLSFIGDGSTGALTIAFGGQAQSFVDWQIHEWSTTRVSSSPIVQSSIANGGSGTPSVSLAAFANAVDNATFVVGSGYTYGLTPGAGYTQISNASGNLSLVSAYKTGADTAPSMPGFGDAWVFYAAEIANPVVSTPAKLAVLTAPTAGLSGIALGAFTVAVETSGGATVTGDTSNVTASITAPGCTLGGTPTVAAVAGVATLSNLVVSGTGAITITFSDGSLTVATAVVTITAESSACVVTLQ